MVSYVSACDRRPAPRTGLPPVVYEPGSYQRIGQYHRPIDSTPPVWCHSHRALRIDWYEADECHLSATGGAV